MDEQEPDIDFSRLGNMMRVALLVGAGVLAITLLLFNQFNDFDLGASAMAVAFGVIAWSATFYFGCLAVAGSLTDYIVGDDTEIIGSNVEHVTRTRSSGDDRLDGWIDQFVFARNTFGLSILPMLILVGLYFWG